MKSIIRGLISVLFMAVLCVGPGAYGEGYGTVGCDAYLNILEQCGVGILDKFQQKIEELGCSSDKCFVVKPEQYCDGMVRELWEAAEPYCDNSGDNLCPGDTYYYKLPGGDSYECRTCSLYAQKDGVVYGTHYPCDSERLQKGECGIDWCHTTCPSGQTGVRYYGNVGEGGCTSSGGDNSGGDGQDKEGQIVGGTCNNEILEQAPEFLSVLIDSLTKNCPDWDSKGDFSLEDTEKNMQELCGLSESRNNTDWIDTTYAKLIVCKYMNVGACPSMQNVPLYFKCVTDTCANVLGATKWEGTAYGNNCSNCYIGCDAPDTGFKRISEDKVYYSGAYCSYKTDAICEYECEVGYYGTATSRNTGCTVCPANATCAGGNDSTFVCADGYFKATANATECSKCPDNATCTTENGIQCHSGYYYKNENGQITCPACPSHGKCEGGQKSFGCDNPAWYKVNESATGCTQCPTGAECKDLMPVTCAKGYYQGGSTPPCTVCPGGGTTSGKNAVSITECYVAVNAGTGLTVYTWDEADDDNNVFGSYQCTVDARYVQ